MSSYFNGEYEDYDISKARSYVEDDIISVAEEEIDTKLSLLPEDISTYQNYTSNLTYYISGAEELVEAYLECDGYDYDDYREGLGSYQDAHSEIDYIFDRN